MCGRDEYLWDHVLSRQTQSRPCTGIPAVISIERPIPFQFPEPQDPHADNLVADLDPRSLLELARAAGVVAPTHTASAVCVCVCVCARACMCAQILQPYVSGDASCIQVNPPPQPSALTLVSC